MTNLYGYLLMRFLLIIILVLFSLQGYSQLQLSSPNANMLNLPISIDSNFVNQHKVEPILQPYNPHVNALDQTAWIIDSVQVSGNWLNYLDPNDIANIDIRKDSKYPQGVGSITLKDHKLLFKILSTAPLSLGAIADTYITISDKHKPILFLLNDKLLTDTSGVIIPDICLEKIVIAKASQLPYFKTTLPDALLMMITTKLISTKVHPPEIMLRGVVSDK